MVIILIVICVCVYFGLKLNNVVNDAEEQAKRDLIVNKEFENELIKKIKNPKYRKEILELVQDDLEYIYGDAWSDLFGQTWFEAKPYTNCFDTIENIILFLMLSKSGLVPDCYKIVSIEISNFKSANAYECLKILHCVEKNIVDKRGDSDYKMVFSPEISRSGYGKYQGPEKPVYEWPCSGRFSFAFDRFHYNSKYAVRDIHSPLLVQSCKNCSIGERSEKEINNPYKDKLTL